MDSTPKREATRRAAFPDRRLRFPARKRISTRGTDMRTWVDRPRHEVSAFTHSDFTATSINKDVLALLTDADVCEFCPVE